MTQQEWLMQQRGLLGGARPIPGMFSNAQMMGGARGGGGGMPMGMSSTTTGEDPLGPPQEDPITTAMKMKYMYEGGQKGKEYLGEAWDWGKKQLGQQAVDMSEIAHATSPPPTPDPFFTPMSNANIKSAPTAKQIEALKQGTGDTGQFSQNMLFKTDIPGTGKIGELFPDSSATMLEHWATEPSANFGTSDVIPWDVPTGQIDAFGGFNAPKISDLSRGIGSSGSSFVGTPSQTANWGGMFPSGATGAVDAAGIFTPSAATIDAAGGLLGTQGGLGSLGSGGMYAGGGGGELLASNVPKGAGGFGSALGALGSAAGVGMNIYDMFDQGVTPGNMMGLMGSGMLGASALGSMGIMSGATAGLGLANAWNPVGWALLGGSVAGSLFDWW